MPGLIELTRILRGPSSLASTPVMASTAAFVAAVHRRVRQASTVADDGADVDDAPAAGAKVLHRFLRRQHQAQHVEVELLVEVLFA